MEIQEHQERFKCPQPIKMAIFGAYGVGKTSVLYTAPPQTLCVDLEAGLLAVQSWKGDVLRPKTWEEIRDLAVLLGAPNPAFPAHHIYGPLYHQKCLEQYSDLHQCLQTYTCIFVDSLTAISRICLAWCKAQPSCFSESSHKLDLRRVYGLLSQELISWLTHLQHVPDKDIVLVGLLSKREEDGKPLTWIPQIEGLKTQEELPGILDEVVTMAILKDESGIQKRQFVCHTLNPWAMPAKDRSGKLAQCESPHLENLFYKMRGDQS